VFLQKILCPCKTKEDFHHFQIVEFSAIHGPSCVPLSLKVKREIISAVQDALDVEVAHPTKRRLIAQLAMKLQQIWGEALFAYILLSLSSLQFFCFGCFETENLTSPQF